MTTNQLPEIQVSPQIYSILKIVCLIAVFTVICINVLGAHASVPPNTTDWNFGIVEGVKNPHNWGYPENYYNGSGYPNELIDDDLEDEDEELEDEENHEEESDEYDNRDH